MDGILIINKKKGITSRDVVNLAIKKLNTKKIGHTGTLDPIATGVLVLCVGKATKLVNRLTSTTKEYEASVTLGISTDTYDSEGKIIKDEICIRKKEEIESVLNSFIGSYEQRVPIYSAVKVNGKKLYEYARENKEVELPKRNVSIYSISLIDDISYKNDKTHFKFRCEVSKGTYIRSLIMDIATKLNTVGIMTDLKRIRQGNFKIDDSISEENINIENIIKIEDVLDVDKRELDESIRKKVINGAPLDLSYDEVLFTENNKAVALYKRVNDKLKCEIMFKGGNL